MTSLPSTNLPHPPSSSTTLPSVPNILPLTLPQVPFILHSSVSTHLPYFILLIQAIFLSFSQYAIPSLRHSTVLHLSFVHAVRFLSAFPHFSQAYFLFLFPPPSYNFLAVCPCFDVVYFCRNDLCFCYCKSLKPRYPTPTPST